MLKADWSKIKEHFSGSELDEFTVEFVTFGLAEVDSTPVFVIAVIENAAEYLQARITFKIFISTFLKCLYFVVLVKLSLKGFQSFKCGP